MAQYDSSKHRILTAAGTCFPRESVLASAWLGRMWTYTVWAACLFMVAIWIILWYERHPMLGLVQAALVIRFQGRQVVAGYWG